MSKKIKYFGINVSLEYSSDYENLLVHLNNLRVEWIRLEFNFFSYIDKNFDFSRCDKFIKLCHSHNIKVLGLIAGIVPLNFVTAFYPESKYPYVFENIGTYLKFLDAVSSRYREDIFHWEIWNEENTKRFWIRNPNVKEYVELLRISGEKIKKNNPDSKIVFGAIAGNDRYFGIPGVKYSFFKRCMENEAYDLFDIANFHPYTLDCYISSKKKKDFLENSIRNFKSVIEYSDELCKRTVWITEFGISRKHVKLTEKEIADIYYKLYLICLKNKSVFFLWNLIGPFGKDYGPLNPETDFSILDKNQKPNKMFIEIIKSFRNS